MKRLKKRMLANRGFSYVITSVLMICVLLIGVAVFEVIRLYIQAGAVRDKFEDSIISMCVENYSEMYQPIRESHAASYRYNGFRWVNSSKANERYIRTYLSRAMNAGEIMQCEIVSVSFNVEPAALAPSDTDSAQKYAVSGTLVIRIPYRFAWQFLPRKSVGNAGDTHSLPICVAGTAAYRNVAGRSVAVAGSILTAYPQLTNKRR